MQATPNSQAWATTLLDECHKLVRSYISPHLQKMFDNSNIAFLDFAEKAQSSASQIQFMEALTVIQKSRLQVEEVFYREVSSSFARFGKDALQRSDDSDSTQESTLSLLSKEETDIEVAIKTMTDSATHGASKELSALRQRLAVLNQGRKIKYEEIPAGPHCLAKAFNEAAKELVLEHETVLIVYMLFDKFVLSKLAPMYHKYNERLLKAGVLPNLKYEVQKHPHKASKSQARARRKSDGQQSQATPAAAAGPVDAGPMSLGDELFGNIMNLMSRHSGASAGGAAGGGAGGQGGGASADSGSSTISNPLPQTAIVTAIDRVQQGAPVEGITAEQVVTIQPGTVEHEEIIPNIAQRLSAERKKLFTGMDRRRVPAADAQVIDLVGMIFEHMLKDEDLPNVAKAELSRLHTPYLKVAIVDKRFFTDKTHPAHELLNTLANAAARWVFEDDLERGIFPALRTTVQRVITEFVNNIELFSELLGSFNRSLNELIDRANAIEERTKQAAAGKEKLGLARNHAAEAIETAVAGHKVPAAIRKLLGEVWLDKLMFIYLREPEAENSPSWQLALQTIEDIIWSVERRTSEEEQAELLAKLPMLRTRVEQAFIDLESYGSSDTETHLKEIRSLQDEAVYQLAEEEPAVTETEEPATSDETQAGTDDDVGEETVEEEPELSSEVRVGIEMLKEIAFGTWFYIQETKKSHPVRVKLSWYSKVSGNYMFVDSMGVKSTVWKQTDLAAMLADGRARVIDETKMPFVKRALLAIRQLLIGDQMLSDIE